MSLLSLRSLNLFFIIVYVLAQAKNNALIWDQMVSKVESALKQAALFGYLIERWMYGIGFLVGTIAVFYTARKLRRERRSKLVIAARLVSYKISLTVADLIILFIYAPTQFIWISIYWWYAGDLLCRFFKFIGIFAFHLTANMQVLIALDRLYITTRLNRFNGKHMGFIGRCASLGHVTYISIAWFFAFMCALPQLFIFRLDYTKEGNPQCVSAWTLNRYNYYNRKTELELQRDDVEVLLSTNVTTNYTMEYFHDRLLKADEQYYEVLVVEQVYNIFHLASIAVLPYLTELLCYAGILYLLKGAKKGQFLTVDDLWQCCACYPFFTRAKKRTPKSSGNVTQRTDAGADVEPEGIPMVVRRKSSGAVGVSNIEEPCQEMHLGDAASDCPSTSTPLMSASTPGTSTQSTSGASATITTQPSGSGNASAPSTPPVHVAPPGVLLSVQSALRKHGRGSVAVPPSGEHRPSLIRGLAASLGKRRRASCPVNNRVEVKPWMTTVAIARRNTRKKAFYMLTMNLIFWGPYCVLGIVTAITVFEDYQQFQFVCALVVFNAITNILL